MNSATRTLSKVAFRLGDLDCHLIRGAMVFTFLIFGYAKWFEYDSHLLVPFISNGPLISWLYPAFGLRGATWFLGSSEWTICVLLFAGFWDKRVGVLGALGSTGTFIATVTIIPFVPDAWEPSAGGFPALTINSSFLMKDVLFLAVSLYLLKQDLSRLSPCAVGK